MIKGKVTDASEKIDEILYGGEDENDQVDGIYNALSKLAQNAISIKGSEDTSATIDEYLYNEKDDHNEITSK